MKDWNVAKALCDDLNRKGVRIDGSLQSVTVGASRMGGFVAVVTPPGNIA